ncbi:MAG: hypothetical protein EHM93_04505 [Bacteroidales bacterium]|nr:MAG: hypothetical protein EHM93_04505 [Bacteroidales bacterium]
MRRVLQITFYLLSVALLFSACQKDKNENDLLGIVGAKLDTITFTHSMKGWELYSWPLTSSWRYSLMVGTNTIKTLPQVKNNPISVLGEDSLKALLIKLPKGEEIHWIGQQRLYNTWNSDYGNIKLPPRAIQLEIKEFCESRYLKIIIEE